MARIRTIKPEFWSDEIIVQLPYHARLLFIGIWNFADDYGALVESEDRIRMQVFPSDPDIDCAGLLDLLVSVGLLDRFEDADGKRVLSVRNWAKHQKVDNPAKGKILTESYRKLAIPSEVRRLIAKKYGCAPGESKTVECYFCGDSGEITWWRRGNGLPSAWVSFSRVEIDHLEPEVSGGKGSVENIVLSCRSCNRGRRDGDATAYFSRLLASPIESSPLEGKGKGREKEEPLLAHPAGEPTAITATPKPEAPELDLVPPAPPTTVDSLPAEFLEAWAAYPKRLGTNARAEALKAWRARIRDGIKPADLMAGVKRYAAFCSATRKTGTEHVMQTVRFFGPSEQWAQDWGAGGAGGGAPDDRWFIPGQYRTQGDWLEAEAKKKARAG